MNQITDRDKSAHDIRAVSQSDCSGAADNCLRKYWYNGLRDDNGRMVFQEGIEWVIARGDPNSKDMEYKKGNKSQGKTEYPRYRHYYSGYQDFPRVLSEDVRAVRNTASSQRTNGYYVAEWKR